MPRARHGRHPGHAYAVRFERLAGEGRITEASRTEAEILTDHERARVEDPAHDIFAKRARLEPRDSFVERDDEELVEAGRRQQIYSLLERGQQRRHAIGP